MDNKGKSKKELIPEMHDIFKITKYGHIGPPYDTQEVYNLIEKFKDYIPDNRTWQGIIQHHQPVEPDTFLLAIADHLAASFARPAGTTGESQFYVYKLWNPPADKQDVRLHTEEAICELFKFINKEPTAEEFFQTYQKILKSRPEDARPGLNITSLYIHLKLTGQFYRLLKNIFYEEVLNKIKFTNWEEIKEIMSSKETREWKLKVIRGRILFNQKPIRAKDVNLFEIITNLIDEIKNKYPDNLVFFVGNEFIIFLNKEEEFSLIVEEISKFGFRLEAIVSNPRPIREITDPQWILTKEWKNYQKELPKTLKPPICQVCQMAEATKHWPVDFIFEKKDICDKCRKLIIEKPFYEVFEYLCENDREKLKDLSEDTTLEDLCETCYHIRSKGIRLLKLKDWTEIKGIKVIWLKLTLDFDILNISLNELYKNYLNSLDSLGIKIPKETEIRFPVISEFTEDYNDFLISIKQNINDLFGENIEFLTNDLFCIKIEKLGEVMKILQIYNKEFNRFFPKFKETTLCPIKISIVAANPKYPFFEIWDILENTKDDILVALIGRGQMRVKIKNLEILVRAYEEGYQFSKSALEKLAKVAEISEALAYLTLKHKADKDYKTYEKMEYLGLDFKSLLVFSKIMEER
jgi:hypothetical protein